jgi:hypothetical protein
MLKPDQRSGQSRVNTASSLSGGTTRVSGDELFVPASHVLVTDRQVSHPAFRLWCVLHRLWFRREPPTMELLQELMGSAIDGEGAKDSDDGQRKNWRPATRRSIERWLNELEAAGWLLWTRREETSRRYHLRTSARSAGDSAVLRDLRSLLNSGKATLADVQALLGSLDVATLSGDERDDATAESHGPTSGSHQEAELPIQQLDDATLLSHQADSARTHTTAESHYATGESHHTIAGSHDTTPGSHDATAESHHTIPGSHGRLTERSRTPQNTPPYREIPQNKRHGDPTPPPGVCAKQGGGGGGPTDTERFLIQHGFSMHAAQQFRNLDLGAVQQDIERRRGLGQGIGAIVTAWRVDAPRPVPEGTDAFSELALRASRAKAEALALAPPDATPLEIQYLALDLEEGAPQETALANLAVRRAGSLCGGGA